MALAERSALEALLNKLEALDDKKYFTRPIREVLANQPKILKRYLREIAHPVDFWTARRSLRLGKYANASAFLSDVRKIFENARTFNESGSPVYDKASELLDELDTLISAEGATVDVSLIEGADGSLVAEQVHEVISARERRNFTPSYHLPLGRVNLKRGNLYITSQEQTSSRYQWEVDRTEEIVDLALSSGVPVERIALPSFARLVDDSTHLPNEEYRAKRRHPLASDDAALFEPKAKKDSVLMQSLYRKIFSDIFEAALKTTATSTTPSIARDTEIFDWVPPQGCRDIGTVVMPPNEFFLIMEELAIPKEQERFSRTLAEGEAQMIVHIEPYSEIKRILGLYGIRVMVSDAPGSQTYHLVREPITAVLQGSRVTFKAVFETVDSSKIPKEYAKPVGRKHGNQAHQSANLDISAFLDEAM